MNTMDKLDKMERVAPDRTRITRRVLALAKAERESAVRMLDSDKPIVREAALLALGRAEGLETAARILTGDE